MRTSVGLTEQEHRTLDTAALQTAVRRLAEGRASVRMKCASETNAIRASARDPRVP